MGILVAMYHHLSRQAQRYEDHVVRLTQQLIRIPNLVPQDAAVAIYVEEVLAGLAYDLVLRDRAGNAVGVVTGAHEGRTILLISHVDSGRIVREKEWNDPPFSGRVRNGRVYGVGAAGGKGALAVQILAGRLINDTPLPLCGMLVVCAVAAEPKDSSAVVSFLLEDTLPKIGIDPDLAVLGEPTALVLCNGCDAWMYGAAGNMEDADAANPGDRRAKYAGHTTKDVRDERLPVTSPAQPLVSRAHEALIAAGFPERPIRKWRPAPTTAGVILLDDHNIPTVAFGPGEEKAAHAPNESVEVKNLVDAVFGTAVLIHSVIGIHPGGSELVRR